MTNPAEQPSEVERDDICAVCGEPIGFVPGQSFMASVDGKVWHMGCAPSQRASTPAPVQDDDALVVKHMVNRFLMWKLPDDFHPDNGISFKPTFNDHLPEPMNRNPIGTNLFDADQAEAMVRYMLEGLRLSTDTALVEALTDALAGWRYIRKHHGDLYGVAWDRVENALTKALASRGGDNAQRR